MTATPSAFPEASGGGRSGCGLNQLAVAGYLHGMRPLALVAFALGGLARAEAPAAPPPTAPPPAQPGEAAPPPARSDEATPTSAPSLSLDPARVRPGDAFEVTVRGVAAPPRGEVEGRQLRFYPVAGGFRALAGLPVEESPGELTVALTAEALSGEVALSAGLEVTEPNFTESRLQVAQRFVAPSPEARLRMKRDQAAFDLAFGQPFEPPLFRDPFDWPRRDEITSHFGNRRVFNGRKVSQHFGVDLGGAVGDPVQAANDGLVVLARNCYASGNSVVLWHGAGLYSVYFHLSRFAVKVGARVRRGDLLGLVGKTGRVTGPHLHWGTKLDGMYVDPESVLRLGAGDGAPAAPPAGR